MIVNQHLVSTYIFRKTNRYSKFNYDFTRPKVVSLDSGLSDEVLYKLNDGNNYRVYVQYSGDDRDEYNEFLEDMVNEKLRKLWIEQNAENFNCGEENENESSEIERNYEDDQIESDVDDDFYIFEDD